MTHAHAKHLIENHVKELRLEGNHLTIYVDNVHPLHELETTEMDHHLQGGLEKIYGDVTYEFKLYKGETPHEREKEIPHDIHH